MDLQWSTWADCRYRGLRKEVFRCSCRSCWSFLEWTLRITARRGSMEVRDRHEQYITGLVDFTCNHRYRPTARSEDGLLKTQQLLDVSGSCAISQTGVNCLFLTSTPAGQHKPMIMGRFAISGIRTISANFRMAEIWTRGIWDMRDHQREHGSPYTVHERLDGVLVLPAWYY